MTNMISFQRVAVVVCLGALAALGQQKPEHKSAHQNASLQFLVMNEGGKKPVRNAEIVLHSLDKQGRQKQESLELKTHEDGRASINGVPYGGVRVQVIAPGFRTYGQDFTISEPTHEIVIKLQRPTDQFSIYK